MTKQANDETSVRPSRMRERVPLIRTIGRVDDAVYAVERVLVTAFLVIMTLASFLKILADFLGKGDSVAIYPLVFFTFFIVGRVAAGNNPRFEGKRKQQNLMAVAWGVLASAYIWFVHASTLSLKTLERRHGGELSVGSYDWMVGKISSSAVVILHLAVIVGMLFYYELRKTAPSDDPARSRFMTARIGRLIGIAIVGIGGLVLSTKIDTGYSWGPQISLVLLLWMAFIGASMATHARKHLTIDAIRKVISPRFERAFNALSFTLAAVVTAAFYLLSYHYLIKRLGDVPEPGNIPDWVKVASIPVAFGLITLRFGCYAIAEAIGAYLKVEPDPTPDVLEVS